MVLKAKTLDGDGFPQKFEGTTVTVSESSVSITLPVATESYLFYLAAMTDRNAQKEVFYNILGPTNEGAFHILCCCPAVLTNPTAGATNVYSKECSSATFYHSVTQDFSSYDASLCDYELHENPVRADVYGD